MENVNVNSGLTQKITEKDNNSSLTPKNNFGLEKDYLNQDAKNFFLELVSNEDWEDNFTMANEPFKGCNGANCHYKTPFFATVTDGVKDLADKNHCHWFIDFILSLNTHSTMPREFQTWYLLIQDGVNYIIGEDGNRNVFASHILTEPTDFTDYGANGVCFWLIDTLLLLPQEY